MTAKSMKAREWFVLVLFVALFSSTSLIGLATAVLLVSTLFLLPQEKAKYRSMPLLIPLAVLMGAIVVSVIFSDPYDRGKALGKLRYMALYPCVFLALQGNTQLRARIQAWLLPIAAILGTLAVLEFFGLFSGHWIGLVAPNPVTGYLGRFYHANGLVFHHVPFAFNCGLLFWMLFGARFSNPKLKPLALAGVALAILLSFSRGGWVALLVSCLGVLAIARPRRLLVALSGSAAAVALLFFLSPVFQTRMLQFEPSKNPERLALWRISIEMFKESPLIGKGFHSFAAHEERLKTAEEKQIPNFPVDPHSMYMDFLGGTGILGTTAFLVFLFLALLGGYRSFQTDPGGLGYMLFFLVAGLTDSHFFSTYSLNGVIFGLAYWQSAIARR